MSLQCETQRPAPRSTGRLELPDEFEAQCYYHSRRDGMTQAKVSIVLGVDQRSVGRAIVRFEEKLALIRASGRFDPEELDRVMAKLIGRAPHGCRVL